MAKNYTIKFKSLRSGFLYTLNIGGGTGTAVELKGGAQPFTTQEDDTDDMFTPVRTQTGYIRIVDDGYAADGVTAFDWRDLMPSTGTERPVILSHVDGGNTYVDWQGFMQAQNFSGVLYGGTQEREFPVWCVLSAMQEMPLDTTFSDPKSFAYILYYFFFVLYHNYTPQFGNLWFHGGIDARVWLSKRVDWRNFFDSENVAQYNSYQVLEEICRFWGWSCRVLGTAIVFACADDADEQNWVELSSSDLADIGASSGTIHSQLSDIALSGDIFVSTDNDISYVRGCKNAVVKSDVNKVSNVIKFAPADMEQDMGNPSIWVNDNTDELSVGYFRTNTKYNLTSVSQSLSAYAPNSSGGFERRLIYSSADSENGTEIDAILLNREPDASYTPIVTIETKNVMTFSQGSLSIKGQVFKGSQLYEGSEYSGIYARLGIGMSRASAQWFYLQKGTSTQYAYPISSGWNGSSTNMFLIAVNGNSINGIKITGMVGLGWPITLTFPKIPVAAALYGYLYLDILGMPGENDGIQIGNLEIEFTREQTTLPTSTSQPRPRSNSIGGLDTEHEYSSANDNGTGDTLNIDCIFASDYDMEYGYGLLMNANGSFMETVPYNNDESYEYAEQHLANRVAAYGSSSRKRLTMELNSNAGEVPDVTPLANVTFEGETFYPTSIGHEWRDDITILTVQEIPQS